MPRVGLRARWAMPVFVFFERMSNIAVPVTSLPVPAREETKDQKGDTGMTMSIERQLTCRRHGDKWGKGLRNW